MGYEPLTKKVIQPHMCYNDISNGMWLMYVDVYSWDINQQQPTAYGFVQKFGITGFSGNFS